MAGVAPDRAAATGEALGRALGSWMERLDPLSVSPLAVVAFAAWAAGLHYSGFDQMYVIVSVMALIFGPGLSRGAASRYSAYSVFNRGQRHILGDLRPEQIDAEQRGLSLASLEHGVVTQLLGNQYLEGREGAGEGLIELPEGADGEGDEDDDLPVLRSRDANKPCQCGSGKKAKRCCYTRRPREAAAAGAAAASASEPVEPDPLLERWRSEMAVVSSGYAKPKR
uniref:SAYSvFN domain-containing protein n=1 Tax=Alexandrium monilatum TaxID=311494 RepID=A0A7S4SL50_9DINO